MEFIAVGGLLILFGVYFRANKERLGNYFDKNY